MYNYEDRINKIISQMKQMQAYEPAKMTKIDDSNIRKFEQGIKGCQTKLNIFVETSINRESIVYLYQYVISLLQEEITIALNGSNLEFLLHYHNDGLIATIPTYYYDDVKKCFDLSCYINTILKLITIYLKSEYNTSIKYGIGMCTELGIYFAKPKIKNLNYNYSFVSTDDTSDTEKSEYLAKVHTRKITDKTMFMNKMFYESIKDVLFKENNEYKDWIIEERDTIYSFYSCNIIITDFNDKIKSKINNKS